MTTNEPVDFLTVPMAGGGSRTLLTRFTDGTVLCCVCWERCRMDDLNPIGDGKVEDVCKQCAADEMAEAARRLGSQPEAVNENGHTENPQRGAL